MPAGLYLGGGHVHKWQRMSSNLKVYSTFAEPEPGDLYEKCHCGAMQRKAPVRFCTLCERPETMNEPLRPLADGTAACYRCVKIPVLTPLVVDKSDEGTNFRD